MRPACRGELHARLRVMGREYEGAVNTGNDLAIWINGLMLFVGVKAVDDEHMLLAFGIQPGSRVKVTLDAGAGVSEAAIASPLADDAANPDRSGCPIGMCQTQC